MKDQNIEQILENIGAESVPDDVCEIARRTSYNFADSLRQSRQPAKPLLLEFVMKGSTAKLAAAAAVIIIVVLAGLPFLPKSTTSVTIAGVLEQIEQARAYMYRMKMVMTGPISQSRPGMNIDMDGAITVSADYGMKLEMHMTDPNSAEEITTQMYVIPDEATAITIIPEKKQYMRIEFDDELISRMKKQNYDPQEMVRQIKDCNYTELAASVIDGRKVQAFETTDPAVLGGALGDGNVKYTLWVDVQSSLPVRSEIDFKLGDQIRGHVVTYDFRWDIPVTADDFKPVIPEDYTAMPTDGMKMPSMNEQGAIEGLRLFAEITGRYPKSLNLLNLSREVAALTNSQHLRQFFQEIGDQVRQADGADKDRLRNELAKKSMEMMQSLQSPSMFYMMLAQDKKDPAYYGAKVTPEFPHAVLLRWKIEAGRYRVIFADLSVGEVTADELAELEAAPLNTGPTAIKPQPADTAAVSTAAEVELSWMPGAFVNQHKVYFGTAPDQMSLLAELTDSCVVPAPVLEKAATYFWRVDEVQPDGSIAAGNVWSFNTGTLIGWWKLDGDADDSSGSDNHAVVVGEPNWVVGRFGRAAQFDGVDDCIETDYAADLPTWTIALWVNGPEVPSSSASAGPVHREKNLQINWSHSFEDFRGAAALSVGNNWYAASFGELQADTWYHLAATYDGENLKAYKNGVLITDNPDPSGAPDKESATLTFARHAMYTDHFKGTIDDVRIYSYDLTADEVASIYASPDWNR